MFVKATELLLDLIWHMIGTARRIVLVDEIVDLVEVTRHNVGQLDDKGHQRGCRRQNGWMKRS